MTTNLKLLMKVYNITTEDLMNELDVPEEVIQYWIKHGTHITDPCYPKLKNLFPEYISLEENPIYIENRKRRHVFTTPPDPHI